MDQIEQAHRVLTGFMKCREDADLPLSVCCPDSAGQQLLVGYRQKPGLSEQTVQERLKTLIGTTPVNLIGADPRRCADNTDQVRPVVGGVQMVMTKNYNQLLGTICVACTFNYDDSVREGFLVSGHVINKTNTTCYQNTKSGPNNIGKSIYVSDWKNGSCDAGFVQKKAATMLTLGQIWQAAGGYLKIKATASADNLKTGTAVKMMGINDTAPKTGEIKYLNATIKFKVGALDDEQTLSGQVLASYKSDDGDSGGPVYSQDAAKTDVTFFGINVGSCVKDNVQSPDVSDGTYAIFSPWTEITSAFGGQLNVMSA